MKLVTKKIILFYFGYDAVIFSTYFLHTLLIDICTTIIVQDYSRFLKIVLKNGSSFLELTPAAVIFSS